jgi:hypothetical protein
MDGNEALILCFDLRDGYWNIALHEDSRKFMAVKTVAALVEYTRMTT